MNHQEAAQHIEANRKRWDALVEGHAHSQFYDMPAFRAGGSSLKHPELSLLGPVEGKILLHLQCHFGQDTLCWARLGASVTGVDFSPKAIDLARNLTQEMGLGAQFHLCNVYDLDQHVRAEHDVVISTYGAIPWLPDLDTWAGLIYARLKQGGTFVLVEFHPAFMMLDFNTLAMAYSYFGQDKPYVEVSTGSYADGNEQLALEECFWNHSISSVLTPFLNRGMVLERMEEYDHSVWNCFPGMVEVEPGRYQMEKLGGKVPMMFGIRMRKA